MIQIKIQLFHHLFQLREGDDSETEMQRFQNDSDVISGGNSETGASAEDVFFHFLSDVCGLSMKAWNVSMDQ